jgi:hypothetical protein
MTISQAYDRLLAGPVTQIDWKDGSEPLRCPEPAMVGHVTDDEVSTQIWMETSEEGLCLHFNAIANAGDIQKIGQTEPLSNIARIV